MPLTYPNSDSHAAAASPADSGEARPPSAFARVPDYETLTYRYPVFLPAEVLAAAEDIAGDSDVIGLEQTRLEWLLRAVLYIDRQLRAQKKGIMPKPRQLVIDHNGVTRWSPMFDSIKIDPLPLGGKRIRVTIKNDNTADFDLTEEQVTHLVALLKGISTGIGPS
jgi:hypothetical protein